MCAALDSLGERQLIRLIEAMADEKDVGYCVVDRACRCVWASSNFLETYGRSLEEIRGLPIADMVGHSYFEARGRLEFTRCFGGEHIKNEVWVEFPPRGRHFLSLDIRPLYFEEDEEVSHVLWAERDLTRFQRTDEDLLEGERKLDCIVHAMQVGTWVWNVSTGEAWFNNRWAEILGFRSDELEPISRETWVGLVHPEDREVADSHMDSHFNGLTDYVVYECRMRHKKGHWVWVEVRGRVSEWKEGKPALVFGSKTDITEKKLFEDDMARLLRLRAESERSLNKIADSIPGAIFEYKRHPDGSDELTYGNEQILEVFGISKDDAVRDVKQLWDGIHPEDLPRVGESVDRSARELSFWDETWRYLSPHGGEKVLNGRGQPHKDPSGVIVWTTIVMDVTSLHRAQDELKRTNVRMSLAADSAGFGFWELNLHNQIEIWDEQVFRLFGISPDSQDEGLVQRSSCWGLSPGKDLWHTAVHPDDQDEAVKLFKSCVEKGEVYENVIRVVLPNGKIRHLRAHANVVCNDEGVAERVVGMNYDITEIVEAEAQLKESERKAREANEAKTQFLSVMNHELRTPLNSIIGPIELLEHSDLADADKEVLALVRPSAEHLLSLINDILNLSKIESGQFRLQIEDVDPATFLNDKTSVFLVQAEKKSIQFGVSVGEELPDFIRIDPYAVTQILYNLVSNALKFTDVGGAVSVTFRVENSAESDGLLLVLEVKDTGRGIPEEKLDLIFDPFFQAHTASHFEDRSLKGTGLGLSICRDLARMMGGDISVVSRLGEGAEFRVALPLEGVARSSDVNPLGHGDDVDAECPFSGLRVLIVEDDANNRDFMRLLTERYDLKVEFAESGERALEMFGEQTFDVMLIDIGLPGITGEELAYRIRLQEEGNELRLIACTAYSDPSMRRRLLDGPFDWFLQKPVSIANFEKALCPELHLEEEETSPRI